MCFLFHLLQISNFFYWTFYENNHKYKSSQELKRRSQTTLLRHNEHLRDPQTRVGFRGSLSLLCGCQDDEIWAGNFWKLKMCCYKVHVGIYDKNWRFIWKFCRCFVYLFLSLYILTLSVFWHQSISFLFGFSLNA